MAESDPDGRSVQSLIDALSIAVGRPVLLDDANLAPLAFSRQWGVDEVRSQSILSRGVQPEVREALLGQGIATAEDVVHTRADPELGMAERVCMPVRAAGKVLGFLWLLDPEADLAEEEFGAMRQVAAEVASQLVARPARQIVDDAALLAGLRSREPTIREAALSEARARGLRLGGRLVVCLLATEAGSAEDPLDAAGAAARRLSIGHAVVGAVPEGAALLASLGDPVLRMLPIEEVGVWAQAVAGPVLVGQSGAITIGALDEAFRQAVIALRLAHSRHTSAACSWDSLGADRLVAQLPTGAFRDLPKPLIHFLGNEAELVETLAAFLDSGGDVKSTAEALSLHRSGLYYRLRRIEELAGLDLSRGQDRLLAHLGVRLLDLDRGE